MIRIFYGRPGGGKSFSALRDLIEELLYGTRLVVTNLSLDLGKLNAYLQREYPKVDFGDINQRVRLISEEETKTFYAFRSPADPPLKVPSKEESLRGVHVDYDGAPAVCYYIDEAHIAFDARNWDRTGPELTFYASQHRKLSDECVFITQHPDMLEKRLRMLAQQFWSHRNHALERLFTFFSKPAYFTLHVLERPPTGVGDPPTEETHRYRLNKELADCYDTSAGIGIAGRKMPEKKRKAGLPVFVLIVPILVVCYVLIKAPKWTGELVSRGLGGAVKSVQEAQGAGAKGAPEQAVTARPGPQPGDLRQVHAPGEQLASEAAPTPPLWVVGYVLRQGKAATVTLSDGRVLTEGDGVLDRIKKRGRSWVFVLVDGTELSQVRPAASASPAPGIKSQGPQKRS